MASTFGPFMNCRCFMPTVKPSAVHSPHERWYSSGSRYCSTSWTSGMYFSKAVVLN